MTKNLPAKQETRFQSLSQEDPLEKEMATHSNILAWEIPWTQEPEGHILWDSKELEMTSCLNNGELYMTVLEEKDSVLIPVGSRFNILMEIEI